MNVREQLREQRGETFAYFAMMHGTYVAMSQKEKEALQVWELEYLDGQSTGTSDWPGWVKYIGPKPTFDIPRLVKKKPIPEHLRWEVWERDDFTCQACGTRRKLTVDHIIPESRGGPLALDNLQTLCGSCNSKKGDKLT